MQHRVHVDLVPGFANWQRLHTQRVGWVGEEREATFLESVLVGGLEAWEGEMRSGEGSRFEGMGAKCCCCGA